MVFHYTFDSLNQIPLLIKKKRKGSLHQVLSDLSNEFTMIHEK